MALSLETAVLLYVLCQCTSPKKILDLGSGFSSFVFRLYASTAKDCKVYTVDDDHPWLLKTQEYLRNYKLSTDLCYDWEAFDLSTHNDFNLALYDLGRMPMRMKTLPSVIQAAGPHAFLILDDVHKPFYEEAVTEVLKRRDCRWQSLKEETLDQFGRYAYIAYGFRKC
jgi:predicted O-methyltransferase YrrM